MRLHHLSLAFVVIATCASAARAHSPCDDRALPDGPLPVGFSQRDFGIMPGACPRTSVGLALDARAIVESENFYGNIRAAGRLDANVQPFPQLELSLTAEPLVYQQVIQSFKASYVGLGDTSLSAKLLAFARQRFAIAVVGRATLPTSLGYYGGSWPMAVEAGPVFLLEPFEEWRAAERRDDVVAILLEHPGQRAREGVVLGGEGQARVERHHHAINSS